MQTKTLSSKTFSNNSFENWSSKRCDFCMYHDLIFEQLERLKQAMMIKNQRISELEQFISRISQMAFTKSPMSQSTNSHINFISPKINQSSLELQNESSMSSQKTANGVYFRKKFEESGEISFSDSKQNTAKFQTKMKENWPEMNVRLQKISELNQMKKQMHRKLLESVNKDSHKQSREGEQSFGPQKQYDTMRSLSEPHQEGHINSIAGSQMENSRLRQLSQRNTRFNQSESLEGREFVKCGSGKTLQEESRSSMDVIREYIKRLK